MQTYKMALNQNPKKADPYETKNMASVLVQLPNNKTTWDKNYQVIFTCHPDGMLGLGSSLIRKFYEMKEHEIVSFMEHIYPINYSVCEYLGIYLAPDSCELIILVEDLGKLSDFTKASQIHYPYQAESATSVSEIYEIDLKRTSDNQEAYEIEDKNVVYISIKLPDNKIVGGKDHRVCLYISLEAMLELGAELIRNALKLKTQNQITEQIVAQINPVEENYAEEQLGIFLTTDICKLLVTTKYLGTVENIIAKLEQT
jgi:hypothetical protein